MIEEIIAEFPTPVTPSRALAEHFAEQVKGYWTEKGRIVSTRIEVHPYNESSGQVVAIIEPSEQPVKQTSQQASIDDLIMQQIAYYESVAEKAYKQAQDFRANDDKKQAQEWRTRAALMHAKCDALRTLKGQLSHFVIQPEQLAQLFHETYERLAPEFGYETRKETAVPWSEIPKDNNNKHLMIAVCSAILEHVVLPLHPLTGRDLHEAFNRVEPEEIHTLAPSRKPWEALSEEDQELYNAVARHLPQPVSTQPPLQGYVLGKLEEKLKELKQKKLLLPVHTTTQAIAYEGAIEMVNDLKVQFEHEWPSASQEPEASDLVRENYAMRSLLRVWLNFARIQIELHWSEATDIGKMKEYYSSLYKQTMTLLSGNPIPATQTPENALADQQIAMLHDLLQGWLNWSHLSMNAPYSPESAEVFSTLIRQTQALFKPSQAEQDIKSGAFIRQMSAYIAKHEQKEGE
jgi:hypothetical protein